MKNDARKTASGPSRAAAKTFDHAVGSYEDRYAAGKTLRRKCPREDHARWKPGANRPDAVELMLSAEKGRLADKLPQDFIGGTHHPTGFAVPQVTLDTQRGLVSGAATCVQHFVGDMCDVLGCRELHLPHPV